MRRCKSMTTYANRGRSLEKAVKKLFESYESRGIHCQQNHPEKLFDGTIVARHGFDFQIFYKGKFYAFDAKECAADKWALQNAKMHQLKALVDIENNGGEAFFLVYFAKHKKLVKFSAGFVQNALAKNEASLSYDKGKLTTINLFGIT